MRCLVYLLCRLRKWNSASYRWVLIYICAHVHILRLGVKTRVIGIRMPNNSGRDIVPFFQRLIGVRWSWRAGIWWL